MRNIPLVYNSVQRDYLANRTRRDIILKPRQKGISTFIQGELRRFEWTRPSRTLTLTKDDENTKNFRVMSRFFYDNLPKSFRPIKETDNELMATYPGVQSLSVIRTAGNANSGRSGTFTHIHFSEAAFVAGAEHLLAAALQAGSPQWVAIESTPNGAQGYFYEECMRALDGESAFTLHFYPWFADRSEYFIPLDDGEELNFTDEEYALVRMHGVTAEQIKWRRDKIKEIGKRFFTQEYPEDPRTCFLTSGDGYFATIPHLSDVFTAPPGAQPQEGKRYAAGLDLGQSNDYTALSIVEEETGREVELFRVNKLPWGEIWRQVAARCLYWGVDRLGVETNTLGGMDIVDVKNKFRSHDVTNMRIIPFTTTAQSKPGLITGFYQGIYDRDFVLLPDSAGRQEIYSFEAVQTPSGIWKYQAANGQHDDTVIARALAWHVISAAINWQRVREIWDA